MRPIRTAYVVLSTALLLGAVSADQAIAESAKPAAATKAASPIYGVTIPDGYRKWQMIAPAEEAAPLDELRVVLGQATTVQVMVKDSRRYASTGGWGFGRFINGQPADLAQHQTCFACHAARVKDRDYVFTRYAP